MVKPNSADVSYLNTQQVRNFCDYWEERGVETSFQVGGYETFEASINYRTKKYGDVFDIAKASIHRSGQSEGNIEIAPTRKLRLEKFHLGITPAFGSIKFNKSDGSLLIKNYSDRLGGDYSILICPTER